MDQNNRRNFLFVSIPRIFPFDPICRSLESPITNFRRRTQQRVHDQIIVFFSRTEKAILMFYIINPCPAVFRMQR